MGASFTNPQTPRDREDNGPFSLNSLVRHIHKVNPRGEYGQTILTYAAFEGRVDYIRHMCREGANPNAVSELSGLSPLMMASLSCRPNSIEALLEEGARPDVKDPRGMQAIHHCTLSGCCEGMYQLLERGMSICSVDYAGETVLMKGAQSNMSLDGLRVAIINGAPLEHQDKRGRTALIHAAICGRLENSKILIEAGAEINAVDSDGQTPLIHAAGSSKTGLPLVKCLIEAGADINAVGMYKGPEYTGPCSALTLAVIRHWMDIVEYLIDMGATVNAEVHIATSLGFKSCVQMLITKGKGALPNFQPATNFPIPSTYLRLSPLQVALLCRKPAIAQYLLDHLFVLDSEIQDLTSQLFSTEIDASQEIGASQNDAMASFVADLSTKTWSLLYLSLLKVSASIGYGQGRKEKVELTELPACLQKRLMFQS